MSIFHIFSLPPPSGSLLFLYPFLHLPSLPPSLPHLLRTSILPTSPSPPSLLSLNPSFFSSPLRSNTAAIVVFQISLSGDVHNLWLAVVDSEGSSSPSSITDAPSTKTAPTAVVYSSPVPSLPLKLAPVAFVPPNPLPRNKEVSMYLEKLDE